MAIIKYKKGNSWISIPIYVNTGGEVLDYVSKAELESMGYISELKTINNLSLIGSGNINIAIDLSNYYTKSEVNGLIPSLNNYYKKSETYSQSEVNALIDSVNAGDLSNYYTKSQVDELIPDDYLTSSSLSGYATQTWVNNKNYAKAADIPTLMSELDNDLGYLTSVPSEYITSSELNSKLSSYAKTSAIPTAASDLTNDMGYLTSIPSQYITESELYRTVTYSQLVSLVNSSSLIPGTLYAITDYSCIYIQPITNIETEVSADDIEYIICTASSSSTLYEDVLVKRTSGYVPIIECKYDINPESCSWTAGMTSKSPKGVIWYMKDANGNSCTYDFKHIKFRRWKITDITANMEKDTGSGGTAGPFKVGMGSSTYNWSDNRHRIGAGESSETTMIPAIFNGTWAACTTDLSTNPGLASVISSFHSDYALQCHKPYNNTTYSDDGYLSWTTDMRSSDGISPASNKGTCTVYGMSNVTVTTSFKDVYTFYNGGDASESTIYGSTEPLVENVLLHGDNYSKNQSLPNTCFLFSNGCINSASTFIKNVKITDPNSNTFLLRTYATYGSSKIENLVCDTVFKSNLCICQYWQHIHFKAVAQFNYFCCDLDTATFGGLINKNVYFGYLRGITIGNSLLNLWYNSFRKIKFSSASSWANPQEGFYTLYFTADNFLDSNILGPFQYSKADSHVNTNTFRCVYNKGVKIESANQCNSYGPLLWGTKIGYGCGQGICFNSLVRTEIPASAFTSVLTKNSTGQEMLDSSLSYIPDMVAVDVKSASANPIYISNMTSSMLSLLSDSDSTTRKILYANNSSAWTCKLYQ